MYKTRFGVSTVIGVHQRKKKKRDDEIHQNGQDIILRTEITIGTNTTECNQKSKTMQRQELAGTCRSQ